jgi:hypothetical protein
MSSVEEIERAVSELTPDDLRRFREWFADFDAELWDRQMERDVAAGRLDVLIEEAREEYRSGRTRPL